MKSFRCVITVLSTFLFFVLIFTDCYAQSKEYNISIQGLEDFNLKKGVQINELDVMKIQTIDSEGKLKAFTITLARGARAVEIKDISGDYFDLRQFVGTARSGDRIVIDIPGRSAESMDKHEIVVFSLI